MRLVSNSETTEIRSEIGLRNRCFLFDPSGDPLRDFNALSLTGLYPRGAKLFVEGQHPKGVFIRRDHFLHFLNNQAEASLLVAQRLSHTYMAVQEQMRALVLSDSAAEKLARLLLSWLKKTGGQTEQNIHLKLSLTHGEIAQMIGVSRETVTRLLGELRDKGIIQLKGANLLIKNKAALEGMVNS
jgi:DNA-binding transcriptional ArsR family regulator